MRTDIYYKFCLIIVFAVCYDHAVILLVYLEWKNGPGVCVYWAFQAHGALFQGEFYTKNRIPKSFKEPWLP